jgi:hypothetical protein
MNFKYRYYHNCSSIVDCEHHDGIVQPAGTCHGIQTSCQKGICQTGKVGGEACGHWGVVQEWEDVGTNISTLGLGNNAKISLSITMGAGDLYSTQFLCG